MTSIPLHQFVARLKERGFTDEQATGLSETLHELDFHRLATKDDLLIAVKDLELRLTNRIWMAAVASTTFLTAIMTILKFFA